MRLYGVGDIATLMAGGFNSDALDGGVAQVHLEADQFARAIRNLVARRVVVPTTYGPQRAALFDVFGVLRASVLVHLDRIGIPHDVLAIVAASYMKHCVGREPDEAGDCLRFVISAVKAGKMAFYQLFFLPSYFKRPADVRAGSFVLGSPDATGDLFDSAIVTVPLLPLFQPLLRALAAYEG